MRMSQSGPARRVACAVVLVAATAACARGPLGAGVAGGPGAGAAASAQTQAEAGVGSLRRRDPGAERAAHPAVRRPAAHVPGVPARHCRPVAGRSAGSRSPWRPRYRGAGRAGVRLGRRGRRGGFVVVYPDGVGHTWNAGICCGPAGRRRIDDLGFLRILLGVVQRNEGIDPRRIAATSISNGGLMDYVLACRLPGWIAAIGPVAATQPEPCPAAREAARRRPTSVLHIHGLDDQYIPFAGGPGTKGLAASRIDWPPVQGVIEAWRQMDGCGAPVGAASRAPSRARRRPAPAGARSPSSRSGGRGTSGRAPLLAAPALPRPAEYGPGRDQRSRRLLRRPPAGRFLTAPGPVRPLR